MNSHFLAVIAILAVVACIGETGTLPENHQDLRAVSTAVSQFSTNLFKEAVKNENKNFICSPVSVSVVLSMAMFGARGDTQSQMRSALSLPKNDATIKEGFQSLIETLNALKKVELRLANKIFTRNGFKVKPEFEEITANCFKSKSECVDFNNTQAASQIIDAWCQAQTNNRIKKIVEPETLSQAAMVLVNAVYFKGQWKKKFDSSATTPEPFFTDEKKSKDIPMMKKTARFNFGTIQELDAEFVELAYESDDDKDGTSMMIILPRTVGGLKKAESNLDKVDLNELCDNGFMTEIQLSLPKFKIESTIDLAPTLKNMGIGMIFTNNADFSGISEDVPLTVSKVFQKAFIEVNEEGSEAAAVTGIIAVPMSLPVMKPPLKIMRIDKPFMYAILHRPTKTVLFQGRFTSPEN